MGGAAAAWCTLARVENDGLQAKRLEPPHAREASCDATADHADAPRCGEAELVAIVRPPRHRARVGVVNGPSEVKCEAPPLHEP